MATDRKQLQSLIDLITFDQKIYDIESASHKEKASISNLEEQLEALQTDLTTAQEKLNAAKKEVKQYETSMKEYDEKEKEKTLQLDGVSSDSEYKAIKKEIDYCKQQQHELEKHLVSAWNKLEQAEKVFEVSRSDIEKKSQELTEEIEKHKQELNSINSQAEQLKSERRPQEEGIPEEWLEKYNMIKSQNSNPLSYVVQDTCSSCFYPLTAQDLLDLDRKKLIQCRECYRFLYRKEEPTND